MCDNINKTIAELQGKGVDVDGEPKDEGYGITTMMHLPGGCDVMLYEPRHRDRRRHQARRRRRRRDHRRPRRTKGTRQNGGLR